jgi:hypothetical protein
MYSPVKSFTPFVPRSQIHQKQHAATIPDKSAAKTPSTEAKSRHPAELPHLDAHCGRANRSRNSTSHSPTYDATNPNAEAEDQSSDQETASETETQSNLDLLTKQMRDAERVILRFDARSTRKIGAP